jgi:pimeloyl-ACP methyl ester carboxylesterase
VLVLPGLGAGDESTAILRGFLRTRGYAISPWGQGRNAGMRRGVFRALRERLLGLARAHGRKVSLVGWSLGGIFARELAKQEPSVVRQVISLASPFTGDPGATHALRLYRWLSGRRPATPEQHERLRGSPPVPTTSIWSRTDGVVSWRCCLETEGETVENIEVRGSHLGMGMHPLVLYAIADRLAQPEGRWAPFRREGWRALAYGSGR